jgi:hypothetical protein
VPWPGRAVLILPWAYAETAAADLASGALHGTGTARLGEQLRVSAATVRGWLRRLRGRAEDMRRDASVAEGDLRVRAAESAEASAGVSLQGGCRQRPRRGRADARAPSTSW